MYLINQEKWLAVMADAISNIFSANQSSVKSEKKLESTSPRFIRKSTAHTYPRSSQSWIMKSSLKYIPEGVLGVSEPPPEWFGNKGNESKNPHWTNGNWLKSRFHFSFAEYNNPHNMVR